MSFSSSLLPKTLLLIFLFVFAGSSKAQALTPVAATLIKSDSSPAVYYVSQGKRYSFPNEKIYYSWYSNFSSVTTVSPETLASYPLQNNVHYKPDVRLVKITTDPKVYVVAPCGVLRWLTSESLAIQLFGSQWSARVDDLPDAFFAGYTIGVPLLTQADYQPSSINTIAENFSCQVPVVSSSTPIPLIDMGAHTTYKGFAGGLYEKASNTPPTDHHSAGMARAAALQPLDVNGMPSATGKIIVMSIGMSNTNQVFCNGGVVTVTNACSGGSFMSQAGLQTNINPAIQFVNGAQGSQVAVNWITPESTPYVNIQNTLSQTGLSEKQVQVIWMKQADARPNASLPNSQADAYTLENNLGQIIRSLKIRYPNLQMVFLSSRTYGGYATSSLNPEPYAYESAFAVKWLIQAQIDQMRQGSVVDSRAGNLDYTSAAPWIAWGPYLWADGLTPRSDGLVWQSSDYVSSDGTHLTTAGITKAGTTLLNFFLQQPYTASWFTQ